MTLSFRQKSLLPFLIPALLTGGGVFLPLLYLILRALEAEPGALREILLRPKNLELLGNTLLLVLGVGVLTSLLAFPLAFLTTRTDLRGRRFLALLLTLPLAIPGYVGAYVLLAATGPGGLLPLPRPEGYWGAVLVLSLLTYPYLFLSLRAAFLGVDPRLEEAARTLGDRPLRAFFRVTLPQLLPAYLSGQLVIALHVLGDFGTVSLLRYETFSYAIYLQYNAAFDRVYAACLALFLLLLTGGLLLLEGRLLRSLSLAQGGKGGGPRGGTFRLGPAKALAYPFLLLPFLLGVVFPLLALLALALRFPPGAVDGVVEALGRSAEAALPASLLALGMALPLAYLLVRHPSPLSRGLERLAYLGYAIPPLAFALGWIFFALRGAPWLYGSLPLLVLVLGLHFLTEALGPVRGALYQVPRRLEEAARTLGDTPTRAFFRVTFPLLWRGGVAGMSLAFISSLKELPITLLLSPPGYATLATRVFSYTQEAMYAEAAPLALLLVLLSASVVGTLLWTERRY